MSRRWTGAIASRSERRLTTAGCAGSSRLRERSDAIEQRSGAHALGDRERQIEIALLEIAEQTSGEPVIVERPRGEQLGAAVGIVLEAAKGFDRVDRGQRVADRLRPGLGVPAELHVPARAVGLRDRGCSRERSRRAPGAPPHGTWSGALSRRSDASSQEQTASSCGCAGLDGQREAALHVSERLRPRCRCRARGARRSRGAFSTRRACAAPTAPDSSDRSARRMRRCLAPGVGSRLSFIDDRLRML